MPGHYGHSQAAKQMPAKKRKKAGSAKAMKAATLALLKKKTKK